MSGTPRGAIGRDSLDEGAGVGAADTLDDSTAATAAPEPEHSPLSDLERVVEYSGSAVPLHRLIVARELDSLARSIGYADTSSELLPRVHALSKDAEISVRLQLAGTLPGLADFLADAALCGEAGRQELSEDVLRVVTDLVQDPVSHQVRETATASMVHVAKLLESADLEARVVPLLRDMMDSDDANRRMTAPLLVSELAGSIGEEICREQLVPEVAKLAGDAMFRVRKAVAQHFGGLCAVVGRDHAKDTLLPVYEGLASDEIWGVRKACAESLVAVAESLAPTDRATRMVKLFERFSEDVSRWVRNCAFQQLGPLIATLSSEQVSGSLLTTFTSMADPQKSAEESDIFSYCAFNFPAVVLTVGAPRWGEVSGAYQQLVRDVQWKVRRTLSHSLHEIAIILGRELAEQSLLTVLDLFLKDLDEVKVGVLRHLSEFLGVLGPAARERYASVLQELLNNSQDNWRMRKLIARQAGPVASLYAPPAVVASIVPLALELCRDAVSHVRDVAVASMASVLAALRSGEGASTASYDQVVSQLKAFSVDGNYKARQLFVTIIERAVGALPDEVVAASFGDELEILAGDKVPNVRIRVACLLHAAQKEGKLCTDNLVAAAKRLRTDEDEDVAYFAANGSHGSTAYRPDPTPADIDDDGIE